MIWGHETQTTLRWITLSVTAQAFGGRVRVALGANNEWATQNNTVWWDDCELEICRQQVQLAQQEGASQTVVVG